MTSTSATSKLASVLHPPSPRRWKMATLVGPQTPGADRWVDVVQVHRSITVRWTGLIPAGRTDVDAASIAAEGVWVVRPTRTAGGAVWRHVQLRALVAPARSFSSLGNHPVGAVLAGVVGFLLGAAVGAYGIGGPLPLIWGALIGALVGYAMHTVVGAAARRHLYGPITDDGSDLLDTIATLVAVSEAPSTGLIGPADPGARSAAQAIAWCICNPATSDADYRRLRYRAHLLHQAVVDQHGAQGVLDAATAVDGAGGSRAAGATGTVHHLLEDVDSLVGRLHARSGALREVAEHLDAVRHPQP